MSLLTRTDLEDFKNICEEYGYNFNEFSLKESNIKERKIENATALLGEVTITRRTISKTYTTGFEQNWVGKFAEDLEEGHFEKP